MRVGWVPPADVRDSSSGALPHGPRHEPSAVYNSLSPERLRWLLAFSSALPTSEVLLVASAVIDRLLPELGDFGFFDLVDEAVVRRFAAAHQDEELEALLKKTQWQRSDRPDINLCALSTGHLGVHPSIDDAWYQDAAQSPEHLEVLRRLAFRSMLTVPVWGSGRLFGAITLFYARSGRQHSPAEIHLAEHVAARAAAALAQAHQLEEARRANRMKDEFLASLSHELRTPLNVILGRAQMLTLESGAPKSVRESAEVVLRNATALARLVDDLLDLSRLTVGQLQLDLKPTRLSDVIQGAVTACEAAARSKGLELRIDIDDAHREVVADALRLQQVFWNLVSNAVKFTPPGGRVTICVRHTTDTVTVEVTDTGSGIDTLFLPHVFEAFRQGPERQPGIGGLGLGLAIVKRLVEMHHGSVEAISDGRDRGATFIVRLAIG